jgi:hypothetical protein
MAMATLRKRNKHSRRTVHKWSARYKKSINCRRPRGFSQRQYCKYGRRKQSSQHQHQHQHQHQRQHQHQHQHQQQRQQQQRRFNQSGGDILNYLPSDATMTLRSIGHAVSSFMSGVKGVQPGPSPLPYNDQKLQKTEVKVSERIPDIKAHYQNAMNLIPSL